MTSLKAAYKILKRSKKPLHYKDITEKAIKQGLIKSKAKKPWTITNAYLSIDIKEKGENSKFYRSKPGYYGVGVIVLSALSKMKLFLIRPGCCLYLFILIY